VALDVTHFEYADRGPTSVYKFRVGDDPRIYVWFEYGRHTAAPTARTTRSRMPERATSTRCWRSTAPPATSG